VGSEEGKATIMSPYPSFIITFASWLPISPTSSHPKQAPLFVYNTLGIDGSEISGRVQRQAGVGAGSCVSTETATRYDEKQRQF
jgi:hypothetical protein